MRVGLAVLLAVALATSCPAVAVGDTDSTLTGTVVLREPATLPADAVLAVTVEDVSRADAPAVRLAQTRFTLDGRQSPIAFSLSYPLPAVVPGASYAVRARVTRDERLLFVTTDRTQVDPLAPAPVELLLDAVEPPDPEASLTGTYWKLIAVGGEPIDTADGFREANLVLDGSGGRFSGSGGVNQLTGDYTLAGDSLTFGEVAMTRMAGPPQALAREQAIVAALARVRAFIVAPDTLTLLDGAAVPVLQAVAVAQR